MPGRDVLGRLRGLLPAEAASEIRLVDVPGDRPPWLASGVGPGELGRWLKEERAVRRNYAEAVGPPPARIVKVWLTAVGRPPARPRALLVRGHRAG